jgi:amidase
MTDLSRADATAQAELVRSGEASPAELVEAAVERVEALNPELNAVIHPLLDKAREAADGKLPDAPFRGVPMVVKDLGPHTAGDPFHEGMRFTKDIGWRDEDYSALIRRFREAGFVIVGKTNTPELGILPTTEPEAYGPARNPWDTDRSTGGSSGGRPPPWPAAWCRSATPTTAAARSASQPSRGRVTFAPDFGDIMSGLVNDHVVCRSVRDCAAILDAIAGYEPGDPYVAPAPQGPTRKRSARAPVGCASPLTTPPGGQFEAHPDVVAAATETGRLLEELGHGVEEDGRPASTTPSSSRPSWCAGAPAWPSASPGGSGARVAR